MAQEKTIVRTPDTIFEARNEARLKLIEFMLNPPEATDAQVRKAVKNLAQQLDCSYESALRYLMTGSL